MPIKVQAKVPSEPIEPCWTLNIDAATAPSTGTLFDKGAQKPWICDNCAIKRFLIDLMRFLSYDVHLYHFGTALRLKKIAPAFVCRETLEKRQYTRQVRSQSCFWAELRYKTAFNRS